MPDETTQADAPSAVTNTPPEAAPGIPAVEVNPSNELLDGENIDEKVALLDDPAANVQVDPSGTRLEDKDAAAVRDAGGAPGLVMPPPAAANLELRRRTDKLVSGMYVSIGAGDAGDDDQSRALQDELRGLQGRAGDGDEKAGRRVQQVESQLQERKKAAEERKKAAEERKATAEERKAASESGEPAAVAKSTPPSGRRGRQTATS